MKQENLVIYTLVEHKKANRLFDVPVANFNAETKAIESVANPRGLAYALRSSKKNKQHERKHKMKKQLRKNPQVA